MGARAGRSCRSGAIGRPTSDPLRCAAGPDVPPQLRRRFVVTVPIKRGGSSITREAIPLRVMSQVSARVIAPEGHRSEEKAERGQETGQTATKVLTVAGGYPGVNSGSRSRGRDTCGCARQYGRVYDGRDGRWWRKRVRMWNIRVCVRTWGWRAAYRGEVGAGR